ncbi:MAG TPA: phytanoyl-CoA dioxygenase family protein [Alphaproteobacteria bacterium]|nr:phytanoyl-CoA dioxygenase family protein [Alphaproteobacteria bacterium]
MIDTSDYLPARCFAAGESLSPEMRAAFDADGYLLLEDFVPAEECDRLRARALDLVAAFDPAEHRTVFSTTSVAHAAAEYFESSGDKIRFFFEEGAFDAAGNLRQDKALSINKIGHAMHDLDPVFDGFSRTGRLRALAAGLGFRQPLLLQSMYIFKQPRIGGEVSWHVDSTYLYTEPLSCIGFWFAVEDATLENGAMICLPGAHKQPMKTRFLRRDGRLVTERLDATPWSDGPRVALEARRGSLVVIHGLLPHFSGANLSDRSRHAYTLHVVDGACRYPADNWLRRGPDLPLRGF